MKNILEKLTTIFGSKEVIFPILQQIIMGMIGAAIVLLSAHVFSPEKPRIGTVDVTGIYGDFIKTEAGLKLPTDKLQQQVKVFGGTLEGTMHEISEKQHVVLVPSQAVLAGNYKDYTPLVREKIQQAMQQS